MTMHVAPHSRELAELIRLERRAFAAKVRMARAMLGWSQSELGAHVGLTQRAIHKLEQGDTEPRRATVRVDRRGLARAGNRIRGFGRRRFPGERALRACSTGRRVRPRGVAWISASPLSAAARRPTAPKARSYEPGVHFAREIAHPLAVQPARQMVGIGQVDVKHRAAARRHRQSRSGRACRRRSAARCSSPGRNRPFCRRRRPARTIETSAAGIRPGCRCRGRARRCEHCRRAFRARHDFPTGRRELERVGEQIGDDLDEAVGIDIEHGGDVAASRRMLTPQLAARL